MNPTTSPATETSAAPTPEISRREMVRRGAGWVAGAGLLASSGALAADSVSEPNALSLSGKVAVVTGSARGIGRAIAVALAKAGADVMGIDIAGPVSPDSIVKPATMEELEETGKLVEKHGRRFIAVKADTRDYPALQAAAARAVNELGKVDIIVANAAIQIFSPIAEVSDRAWHDVIDVNVNGTVNTVRAFLPNMIQRKAGRIILIASGQGRHGMKNGSSYSASKWAVIGFMKSIALELGEYHITVNTVEPGLVDTALTRNKARWNEALKQQGLPPQDDPREEDVRAALLIHAPLGVPWLQPEDIAPPVVFLASDAAAWVSGASYDVTGGDSAMYTA